MKNELKQALDTELANNKDYQVLVSPAEKKRKLITYAIRTLISIGLYYYFWEISWVRWTLLVYIPLNLIGLYLILNGDKVIQNKINKTYTSIDKIEE